MTKQGGMGDNFYVQGRDISGDINSFSRIGGGPVALEQTGINKFAFERNGGKRDGGMAWTNYFNDATDQAHLTLRGLPTTDIIACYFRGTAVGSPAASLNGKQLNYDLNRGDAGDLLLPAEAQGNSYGLEWGEQLTAGKRTDTGATNGASVDFTAATAFGAQAYLQVFAFAGTDVTVKLQDSADNATFADIAGGGFTQITSAPGAQRLATADNATIRRYVRAVTVTTGGFTNLVFAVMVVKNASLTVF